MTRSVRPMPAAMDDRRLKRAAHALAEISSSERRSVLDEAARLEREQCCGDAGLADHLDPAAASTAARTARALADPIRAQIFDLLRRHGGEVCQCDLQPLFHLSQPTLSHHLEAGRRRLSASSAAACGPTTTSSPKHWRYSSSWLS